MKQDMNVVVAAIMNKKSCRIPSERLIKSADIRVRHAFDFQFLYNRRACYSYRYSILAASSSWICERWYCSRVEAMLGLSGYWSDTSSLTWYFMFAQRQTALVRWCLSLHRWFYNSHFVHTKNSYIRYNRCIPTFIFWTRAILLICFD